jgi:MFS family permease
MSNLDSRERPVRARSASLDDAQGGPVPEPNTPSPTPLAVYYALIVTQAVSQIGSQVSTYAVGIAVFRASGHATPLALVVFFSIAPSVLLGGLAGALADRFDRRGLMLAANVGYVAVNGLLLASFASGAFQLWHLYAVTVGAALFAVVERPAFQASVAMLVPDSLRDRANAIAQMALPAAGVVAPAVAGLLYAIVGVLGAIIVDIATFVVAIGVLAVVRIPRPVETAEGRAMRGPAWRQVFDGFAYLAAHPTLLGFNVYVSVVNFIANTVMVLLTPYVLARTGGAQAFGAVLATMNAGGIAGSLVIGAWGRIGSRMHTVMLGTVAAGLCVGLAGVSQSAPTIAASLFCMMFALALSNAPFDSMMQAKVPPDLQGRVFAALLQASLFLTPIAALIGGPWADQVFEPARRQPVWRSVAWLVGSGPGAGMALMFAVAGALIVALSLAVYAIPAVRRLEADLPDYPRR